MLFLERTAAALVDVVAIAVLLTSVPPILPRPIIGMTLGSAMPAWPVHVKISPLRVEVDDRDLRGRDVSATDMTQLIVPPGLIVSDMLELTRYEYLSVIVSSMCQFQPDAVSDHTALVEVHGPIMTSISLSRHVKA